MRTEFSIDKAIFSQLGSKCIFSGRFSLIISHLEAAQRLKDTLRIKKGRLMLKNLLFSIPVSLFCVLANAQTVTTASSTPANTLAQPAAAAATSATEVKKEDPKAKFSLALGVGYESQLKKQTDGSRSEELSYTIMPAVGYGDYTFTMLNIYIQDLRDTGTTGSFIDPNYIISRKGWTLNDYFKLSPSATVVLPMNESSKNNTGLLYNVAGALTLGLQTKALGMDDWSISYQLGYLRNFTQFSTNAAGDPLTAYRLRQRFNVGYQFTDKLSLATRLQIDSNYSAVEANVVKNSFLHYQTLAYALTDSLELSVGHTNAGPMLIGSQYENNLKFTDEKSSVYSVGLDLSL
jgi:hypothetical protein